MSVKMSWLDAVKIKASHASYEVSGAECHEAKNNHATGDRLNGAELLPSLALLVLPAPHSGRS